MEWYRYARLGTEKANFFQLAFDGNLITIKKSLHCHKLCQSSMLLVMGISGTRMQRIREASQVGFIPPQHKGKGKVAHNAIRHNDACLVPLKAHFDYMMNLGEVRVTRVAATLVDGVAGHPNREDTEDMVYLPISMGYRNCYKRYMDVLGYRVRSNAKGAISVKEVGDNGKEFVSLQTYFDFWKSEYPHLKISRPVEDICLYCFAFSNWHRYLASHSYQSGVNDRNDEVDEGQGGHE
jgi:hypothetical protein